MAKRFPVGPRTDITSRVPIASFAEDDYYAVIDRIGTSPNYPNDFAVFERLAENRAHDVKIRNMLAVKIPVVAAEFFTWLDDQPSVTPSAVDSYIHQRALGTKERG